MDITEPLPARDTRGMEIQGIVMDTLRYKSEFILLEGATIVDWGAVAGTNIVLGWIYYAKWRVAGIGWRCHTENFTDDEDPALNFGSATDADLFGQLKLYFGTTDKMVIEDVASYDNKTPAFLSSIFAETMAGKFFYSGDPDGSVGWQTTPLEISVENVTQLTTGKGYPFVLIEVNRV